MKTKLILVSLLFSLVSCDSIDSLFINTTDSFVTRSPTESQKKGVYLCSFHKVQNGGLDIIDSVWYEKLWKYNAQGKVCPDSNAIQTVIRLKKTSSYSGRDSLFTYLSSWNIEERTYGKLGTMLGVFMDSHSPKEKVADTLVFFLHTQQDSAISLGIYARDK